MSNAGFLIGQKGVKYGLSLNPKKVRQQANKLKKEVNSAKLAGSTLAAFAHDEEEDAEASSFRGAAEIAREQAKYTNNARVAAQHAAALAEDPTAFDYDGVIDEIHASRVQPKQAEKIERKSKYITTLMDRAKDREREQSIIYERQLLKERKKEDHMFGDKDKFVTSGYKKKLQEDAQWLEEEKMRERREEDEDVTKRKDLSGFYSNLLKSNSKYTEPPAAPASQKTLEPAPPESSSRLMSANAPSTTTASVSINQTKKASNAESCTGVISAADSLPSSTVRIKAAVREERREEKAEAVKGSNVPRPPEESEKQPSMTVHEAPHDEANRASAPTSATEVRPSKEDMVAAAKQRYLERKRKVAA